VAALGALNPDAEPRATEHIPEMIEIISALLDKGYAYHEDGHVLFHVPSMPDYGKLSGHSRDELIAGARVEVAPYKKDAADFVLWKPSTEAEPGWDSPWGRGRPGWHVECSAMSMRYLGDSFDIHGGGRDLIFPHHENEIAQSVCAHPGSQFAKYWMHNGYLMAEGEKMSKSLGNFYTIHELLQEFPGEAIRLVLLQTHYRQPLDFTKDGLAQARHVLDRFYGALRQVADVAPAEVEAADVLAALRDDLNTPLALSVMHAVLTDLNKAETPDEKARLKGLLLDGGAVMGLFQQDPEEWFRWQPAGGDGLTDAEIEDLIRRRTEARKAKDFAEADRVRDELADKGVILEDKPEGTIWRRG
jgi:cysteinyl-tRNA synthetase